MKWDNAYFGPGTVHNIKCHLNNAESKGEVDAVFVNAILAMWGSLALKVERCFSFYLLFVVHCVLFLSHAEKIGRTSEFLIYGQGQQRNAVIEAIRLLENGNNRSKDGASLVGEESKGVVTPKQFKDKAKKWQKFVTQAKASGRTSADYCELGNEIGVS
ncbi:ATP-dependent DNA helicase SRS2-like protein At4g25120 [Arachis ipaensis]|uniref:ATP-dependent DNA helicase SRS2-like protein At4g25120 n=1 Tax=Arachis ipaensis TaxID=130454 RepID=UPI000A2B2933|nr:ATP-dependent DNA helicase SRS2-like protein At4g25120 [Arachis ipaensis]